MKKILLPILFVPGLGFAQSMRDTAAVTNQQINLAGYELERYYNANKSAITLELGGIGLVAIGAGIGASDAVAPYAGITIAGAGGILSLAGLVIQITSYKHIQLAGWHLQGKGIAMPIKKKTKHYSHDSHTNE